MIRRTKECKSCRFCDTHWGWYCTQFSQLLTKELDGLEKCDEFKPKPKGL